MYTTIIILIILASILMCLVVLIQESKGGGLAAAYASGNTLLGAPKTTNVIEKITWGLAIAMIVLSIVSTAFLPNAKTVDSVLQMEQPITTPIMPTNATAPADASVPATAVTEPAAESNTGN